MKGVKRVWVHENLISQLKMLKVKYPELRQYTIPEISSVVRVEYNRDESLKRSIRRLWEEMEI
ncbi:MAG: hypothetical protein QXT63_07590 [Thermoplasmata archaeon]